MSSLRTNWNIMEAINEYHGIKKSRYCANTDSSTHESEHIYFQRFNE